MNDGGKEIRNTMKSLFEELGGTYTLGEDGMYYPNLKIDDTDQRPIGRWAGCTRHIWKKNIPGCMIG